MSTSPLDELSEEEQENLVNLAKTDAPSEAVEDEQGRKWTVQDLLNIGLTRRQALSLMASVASGAVFATALKDAIEPTRADPSTTDNDGDVGTPSDRVDVFSDGVDANSVDTAEILNEIDGAAIQASWDGLVVPVAPGLGMDAAIDPAAVNDPVQDAHDAVLADGGQGAILLPAEGFSESSPITWTGSDLALIGWGVNTSVIYGQDETHMLEFDGGTIENPAIDGVSFIGPQLSNQSTSSTAIVHKSRVKGLQMGAVAVKRWYGPAYGIDASSSPRPYNCKHDYLNCQTIDAGDANGVIELTQPGPGNEFGNLYLQPVSDNSADGSRGVYRTAGGHTNIVSLNLGGSLESGYYEGGNFTGASWVQNVNYEPTSQPGATDSAIHLASDGMSVIGPTRGVDATGGSGAVDYWFRMFNAGNKLMFPNYPNSVTVSNNQVEIITDPTDYSWYFGPGSDVADSAGSSTGFVRSLGNAGTGHA